MNIVVCDEYCQFRRVFYGLPKAKKSNKKFTPNKAFASDENINAIQYFMCVHKDLYGVAITPNARSQSNGKIIIQTPSHKQFYNKIYKFTCVGLETGTIRTALVGNKQHNVIIEGLYLVYRVVYQWLPRELIVIVVELFLQVLKIRSHELVHK